MKKWTRALYQPNRPLKEGRYVTAGPEHIALSARAAAEGMVLLKNEGNVLPLDASVPIAPLGRGVYDTVKGGGGSGDVYCPYVTTLADGIEKCGGSLVPGLAEYYRKNVEEQYALGAQPGMTVEPAVPLVLMEKARKETDTAVIAFSRFSGEGWERKDGVWESPEYNPWGHETALPVLAERIYPEGDFYLTKMERALVEAAVRIFPKVIAVIGSGGIIDLSWAKNDDRIGGLLWMGQAGMEGGTAAARILFGQAEPSGRLPDTFAARLEDYPSTAGFHASPWYVEYTEDIYVGYRYFETFPEAREKVVYPFGYGLSYTTFERKPVSAALCDDTVTVTVRVTNTGARPGREVAALYYEAPQGKLGRPARELGAFAKTKRLLPGESEDLVLSVTKKQMAAFDDLGKVQACAFVLEAGEYKFYLGGDVRGAVLLSFTATLEADEVIEQLSDALCPNALAERLTADGTMESLPTGETPDLDESVIKKMEPGTEEALFPGRRARSGYLLMTPYKEGAHPLIDVVNGEITMDEFMDQLSDDDLIALVGGAPNTGVANVCGFGGLDEYGVPAMMTSDGPAGVRINEDCGIATTAWPTATLLASTWDTDLLREVGCAAAEELKENNLQIWLAPAMNIHRNPLCGRNFEYFSEDPLLTGRMAAAEVRGIQSLGVSACIKHFAANNKETNRKHSDSRVSMRALREIYLKGFEITVKEGKPLTIMSAYNAINGHRCSESRDLLTKILREEWGYDGLVTTDWWTRGEHYKEILAGNDIKMACGFPERVREAMDKGAIGMDDIRICARRVLELICRLD